MRRAFTLVEALVATVAASVILVILYGSLVFYSRAYTREDEALERGRRGQEVLGLFRDDAERADGEVQPAGVPAEGLKAVGWRGDAGSLLATTHKGTNVINCYQNRLSQKPYLSRRFGVFEVWEKVVDPGGGVFVTRVPKACKYVGEQPPQRVSETIGPMLASASIVHIPIPYDNPTSEYVVMQKVTNNVPTPVIWAFHKQKTEKWPAFSLVRWTPQTGVQSVGGEQIAELDIELFYDWGYVDPVPPKRPNAIGAYHKMQARLNLTFGRSKVQGTEPAFSMGAQFLIGP